MIKLIECPRDAMQGLHAFIPTSEKVKYLNQLLQVGFDTLDFGSFVSPRAVPQMRDTPDVIAQLNWQSNSTKLLAIVANLRGAEQAVQFEGITYLGFPLSISETFQQRNTNKSISEALDTVVDIQELCAKHNKEQVVYISMAFGNPYGDPYSDDAVIQFAGILGDLGVGIVSLADTIGAAAPHEVSFLYKQVSRALPELEIGLHLHARPDEVSDKVSAALEAGCKRIDGALKGFGGCPMAQDKLVGNIPTEKIIEWMENKRIETGLNKTELNKALAMASEIFPNA
ncbi:MAG: hydroxymethylglutaryl-CoA lyase [Cyclobacteriaceae bacterium]|nr:hydroxymethylglutaryl-CoA lyase [Cyclobacteriaceae bacterium]MCX7636237.1 hydroxymethylglutaryl-CoA lyase [Cyclobacteriaceae bacterium]MDW8331728.1 hydroxymethylglutaryl-CoA lyase [Cyclobacteriaceae bacterium]